MNTSSIKIFISYSRANKDAAIQLYEELATAGFNPWLDIKNLLPGQEWKDTITEEIRTSDFIILLFSKVGLNRRGHFHYEMKEALEVYHTIPPGHIFLIPVRLDKCIIPLQIGTTHHYDMSDKWSDGFEAILKSIDMQLQILERSPIADSSLHKEQLQVYGANKQQITSISRNTSPERAFLAIGNPTDDSYFQFCLRGNSLSNYGFHFLKSNYRATQLPESPFANTIVIFLYFPFKYWNTYIESPNYKGVYGNKSFYVKFRNFWKKIGLQIRRHYQNKSIYFVNEPEKVFLDRDKKLTKDLFLKAGLKVPKSHTTRDTDEIIKLVETGVKLYIKVRYGSMGKGITYLEKGRWCTNFSFIDNKIRNVRSDRWLISDVTNKRDFLNQLLKTDVIVEEKIPPWKEGKKKLYLRIIVLFGEVVQTYPRSALFEEDISLWDKAECPDFLNNISSILIQEAEQNAICAVAAIGLNFAGVDVMLDQSNYRPVVIEVNAFPGFPNIQDFNLSEKLIEKFGMRKWE